MSLGTQSIYLEKNNVAPRLIAISITVAINDGLTPLLMQLATASRFCCAICIRLYNVGRFLQFVARLKSSVFCASSEKMVLRTIELSLFSL